IDRELWMIGQITALGELQRLEICNSLRSPIHVLARSASAWLAAAVLPRALYNSASPKYDQALAGARASARWNCCSASSKRPACSRAAARDCRIGEYQYGGPDYARTL